MWTQSFLPNPPNSFSISTAIREKCHELSSALTLARRKSLKWLGARIMTVRFSSLNFASGTSARGAKCTMAGSFSYPPNSRTTVRKHMRYPADATIVRRVMGVSMDIVEPEENQAHV
jgi:hypothetical protein